VGSLTNETFSTTANVTDMPQARYITRYRDRMYVANLKIGSTLQPYRVVFSSVPVSGTLSWTPATDFFDVDYGQAITGLGSAFNRLMIFTDSSAWSYDGNIIVDNKWPG